MKNSIKVGFSFGLTSGVITTLGLMMGLYSGTHLKIAVILGILSIAIADAFSDALGIHISEESEQKHQAREIWESTLATFFSKFIFALTFIIPVLVFRLKLAMIIAMIWGFFLLAAISFKIAGPKNSNWWKVVAEHTLIAAIVIIVIYFIGNFIRKFQ